MMKLLPTGVRGKDIRRCLNKHAPRQSAKKDMEWLGAVCPEMLEELANKVAPMKEAEKHQEVLYYASGFVAMAKIAWAARKIEMERMVQSG